MIGKKTKNASPGLQRRTLRQSEVPKIHNYYALPSRGDRPEIDYAKRGARKKSAPLLSGQKQMAKKGLLGIIIIASFTVLVFLSYLDTSPIVIVDSTPSYGREQQYGSGIMKLMESSIWRRNKFTLSRQSLSEAVRSEFPEVAEITIATPMLGSRPVVHIREHRLPFQLESRGSTFVVTTEGVVSGKSEDFQNQEKTILIRDESGIEPQKGTRVLRSDDANFFTRADALLREKGRVLELIRITTIPREAYLKINGKSYEVRVFLDESVDTQIATFLVAERALGEGGTAPQTYIDVRAGEKVFWQ